MGNTTIEIIDSLRKANAKMERFMPCSRFNTFDLQQLYGLRTIEVPVRIVPRLQIRKEFKHCSKEFREEVNNWLLGMFGSVEECPIAKNQVYMFGNHSIAARPETLSLIANLTTCT